jgi:thioredoxin 1
MAYQPEYASKALSRDEVDQMQGPVLLEFGANWCGHCSAVAPRLEAMLKHRADFPHIKVEDGPGKALGRSFRVKLWPTLVFMRDGQVLMQMSRPDDGQIRDGLDALGV